MGLRARLMWPLIATAVLLAGYDYLIWPEVMPRPLEVLLMAGVLAALALAALNVETRVLRPLRRLRRAAEGLVDDDPARLVADTDAGELGRLAGVLVRLQDIRREQDLRLAAVERERAQTEQALEELRSRYVLTVERANDGIWEWDLRSDTAEFSPRWRSMLGYAESTQLTIAGWRELIHADDREAVLMGLRNHLDALTPAFDAEYRVRAADGQPRWLHSRGSAIRHASGKACRLVVMDNDIDARKRLEDALVGAAEGLSAQSGPEFFRALARSLAQLLGTRDSIVAYCIDDPPTRARTLAYYTRGAIRDDIEFDLEGTSCGAVIARREIVYCPTGVCEIWPAERVYDRDSYLGVPMFDSTGRVIGHFACMDSAPMRHDLSHLAIFRIFSVRAAAELERLQLTQQLDRR